MHVFDAETGDPVTPPIEVPVTLGQLFLDAATRRLSTATFRGYYEWDLNAAPSEFEELATLSHILSGLRLDDIGSAVPILPDALARELLGLDDAEIDGLVTAGVLEVDTE